ncbi:NDR1/HIN1-like protein 12 [Quillaja saponaria]|uniref:NDR1/HIN1-like protein 12 n=1 Tax=Quillaja saponaria TaxID=32244 RepID=A0AAD7VHM8_QUISA|nr:NDR1/HIN1-like protein 12 [Quillaja saponaria]
MSVKECGHHKDRRRKIFRRIFAGILVFLFIVLLTILIIWLVLKPSKPSFILQDATVYTFNASTPNILTSNFQVTLSSRNPNDKIGIYYDRLDAYATYRNQQITLRVALPPTYQDHKEVNVWSPYVFGNNVPVAPYNSVALSQDQNNGAVLILLKIDGRVRWRVGAFISGRYHIHVKCPAYITFGNRNTGVYVGNAVKYQLVQRCSVSV